MSLLTVIGRERPLAVSPARYSGGLADPSYKYALSTPLVLACRGNIKLVYLDPNKTRLRAESLREFSVAFKAVHILPVQKN